MHSETARNQMVLHQVRAWEVLDARVLQTLSGIPREAFVPPHYRDLAFADFEIPLAHGELMMAPSVEGKLLQALRLTPLDEVLEIGTGSGFLTACLARLAGRVESVDIHADFADQARRTLAQQGVRNVSVRGQDAFDLDTTARYDAIAVTGSIPRLDRFFVEMLRPGGRLFVVVGRSPIMEACLVTRHAHGDWTEESLFETSLKPLINVDHPEPFAL